MDDNNIPNRAKGKQPVELQESLIQRITLGA